MFDKALFVRSLLLPLLRTIGRTRERAWVVRIEGGPVYRRGESGDVTRLAGFFTTRWVLAESSSEAEKRALELARCELTPKLMHASPEPTAYRVEWSSEVRGPLRWSGKGFTFYEMED